MIEARLPFSPAAYEASMSATRLAAGFDRRIFDGGF
jgi:hypothetical protein